MKEPVQLELEDVLGFKFCPLCGDRWIEVYLGDYYGHIRCYGDNCEADIDFKLDRENYKNGGLKREP